MVEPPPAWSAPGTAAVTHRGHRCGRRSEHPGLGPGVRCQHDREHRLYRFRARRRARLLARRGSARTSRLPHRRCGPAISRWRQARGRLLAAVTTVESLLLAGALAIAAGSTEPFGDTARNLIAVVSAIALGMQNAAARELAVPDATTTVLTMTLTGFAADLRDRNVPVLIRRLLAIVAMLVGALIGAILVLRRDTTWA